MESTHEKRPLQSAVFTIQDGENAIARLQRQITQLEERLANYFHRLDELEKFCQRTQDKFEATQRRIRKEYELIQKQHAAKTSEHSAALKRTNKMFKRRNEKAARLTDENDRSVPGNAVKQTVEL